MSKRDKPLSRLERWAFFLALAGLLYIGAEFYSPGLTSQVMNAVTVPMLNNTRPTGGYNCGDAQVVCVGKDSISEFSTICGNDCTIGDHTCDAGTALASITDASVSKPYSIIVGPGVYDECVSFDETSFITLHVSEGAVIRPTGTVNGGVVKIAPDNTAGQFSTSDIRITGNGLIQNDSWGTPESAIQIGAEVCSGDAKWNRIQIDHVMPVGLHDSIQWCGANTGDLPTLTIHDISVVGGNDVLVKKGNSKDEIWNVDAKSWSNYCESNDTDITNAITGSVNSGAGSTSTFRLEDNAVTAKLADGVPSGRRVVFGGGGGCPADGHEAWINDYQGALGADIASFTPVAPGTLDDSDCTYAIDEVANAEESPCRDIDWSVEKGTSTDQGLWKMTCFHFGVTGPAASLTGDIVRMKDSRCTIKIRDFGPDYDSGCTGQGGAWGLAVVDPTVHWERAVFQDVDIDIEIDMEMNSTFTCAQPIAGLITSGSMDERIQYDGEINIRNNADTDVEMAGIAHRRLDPNFKLVIPSAVITLDQIVGGYTGTANHLYDYASYPGTVITGDIITGDSDGLEFGVYGSYYFNSKGAVTRDGPLKGTDLTIPAGDQDALDIGFGSVIRASGKGARVVGGIAAGSEGRRVDFINVDTVDTITLEHEEGTALELNRITSPTGADIVLSPNDSVGLWYDYISTDGNTCPGACSSRWRIVRITQ